jgi:hypothetical protein
MSTIIKFLTIVRGYEVDFDLKKVFDMPGIEVRIFTLF